MKNKHIAIFLLLSLGLVLLIGCSRKAEDKASSVVRDIVDDVTDGHSSRVNDGVTHNSSLPVIDDSALLGDSHPNSSPASSTTGSDESSTAPSSKVQISEEEAKRIALAQRGVTEDEVSHFTISLDFDGDHAIPKYDVAYYVGQTHYTFEIDARDGSITEFETDDED